MKYIVLPKSVLDEIPQDYLNELHLVPRVSTDGMSVIMKVANYDLLFPPAMTLPELGEDAPVVASATNTTKSRKSSKTTVL